MIVNNYYAVYSNLKSFYGNIGYGQAPKKILNYGAWPRKPKNIKIDEEKINLSPLEVNDSAPLLSPDISGNIQIIRNLRKLLSDTEDTIKRKHIREAIAKSQKDKENAFRLKARIDEEETLFILLH